MATEEGHSQEFDLERTDRLPIITDAALGELESAEADADPTQKGLVALQPDATPGSSLTKITTSLAPADFVRPAGFDLPSLAESVRSVEERIARQQLEYETLSRDFARSRDAEHAASARAGVLEREVGTLRGALESEQARLKEHEKALAERTAQAEASRTRTEEALRETERFQSEARTLRDSLAARDASIVQVTHSLGERDAQLATLQRQHAEVQQSLELRGRSHTQLEGDISTARALGEDLERKLKLAEEHGATLAARLQRTEAEINQLRAELGSTHSLTTSYLERLRTREYRRGFDENLFRELDARVGSADAGHGALQAECERLRAQLGAHQERLDTQSGSLEKLQAEAAASGASLAAQAQALRSAEAARSELENRLGGVINERDRLSKELNDRSAELSDARAVASGDVKRITELLSKADERQADLTAQISQLQLAHATSLEKIHQEHAQKVTALQSEHLARIGALQTEHGASSAQRQMEHAAQLTQLQTQHAASVAELLAQAEEREQEMTVLMAHLQEARRPLEPVQAELKRLAEDLAGKNRAYETLAAEAQELRAGLERTKGALEEREFLIRRLERAESNNANVLGRIQTSMERLGSAPLGPPPAATTTLPEWSAELIRVDGDRHVSHSLARRTRIGRATNCELQVDCSSVSRHHAVIVSGPRETVIEDLNSTNGVIINGRKVTRAFLNDGDVIVVGEVHFKFSAKGRPPVEVAAPEA